MKKLILSLVVLSFASVTAQAADTLKFHNLGFSTDGKYYSYATSAVGDGSGYGYANVFIKQVDEYDRGEILRVTRDTEVDNDRLALKLAIQSVNFTSFGGLIPYGIRGETVTPTADKEITLNTYNAKYRLQLKTLPARFPNPMCKNDWDIASSRLELAVTKTDSKGKSETQVLFSDYSEPGARICAQNYKIAQVIRHDDRLVLVISYDSPGFEGMDHDFVVLSTKLN
ncbi:hypothetical protein DOM22_11890 [Bdellovibrio sp. ZAP7]|uniref:DUF2259 domain-containing protein n=1 Tax=Bdellovibrio sp. ZAP7 TaxID=2231053 RepID=UPI00115A179C|nr:DUF2259 domain-containing protein [Bdellovibrio sp. ZAP7]QDK45799.1 hypothetical protein DOM22_11890 [Bdellovibrio sp. ZAP7]